MKHFIFLILSIIYSPAVFASLPDDKVPSINDQIDLYRKAYAPFNHKKFNPEQTHIPDLVPMVKIAHSYAAQGLTENEEQLKILTSLWKETEKQIETNNLTISYFLKMNMRLAFLFSFEKKMSLMSDLSFPLKEIKDSLDKWNIETYEEFNLNLYPFCFEAVLYTCEKIPDKTFLDNYLNPEFPMGLKALHYHNRTGLNEEEPDPASLMLTDYHRFEYLSFNMGENNIYWPVLRDLFRKIYTSYNDSFATTAIFFYFNSMLIPDLRYIMISQKEFERIQISENEIKDEATENLPLCELLCFKRLLEGGEDVIERFGHTFSMQLWTIFKDLKFKNLSHINLNLKKLKKSDISTYEGEVEVEIEVPNSLFFEGEESGETTLFHINLGGVFKTTVKIEATKDLNKEKIFFENVIFNNEKYFEKFIKNKDDYASYPFELEEELKITAEENLIKISDFYKLPYTKENIKDAVIEALQNLESITYSRKALFNPLVSETCDKLNFLSFRNNLTYTSDTQDFTEAYGDFIETFYFKYKDLFSTEKIETYENK